MPANVVSRSLAEILGVWANKSGPLHRQLADAIAQAIDRRDLLAGMRLPPERTIAKDLAVSRTTVVTAFDRLKASGHLDARQGAGTWVAKQSRSMESRVPDNNVIASFGVRRLLRATSQEIPSLIEMAAASFFEPIGVTDALLEVASSNELTGMGYLPFGHPRLREVVADHLTSRGVRTEPSQVLITTGVAQAMSLLASLFVPDGEPVVVENPTWAGLLDVLRANGSRIWSVPVDDEGMAVEMLPDVISRSSAALIAVVPDFHNPTGAQLSLDRRRRLAAIVDRMQLPLIENIALADLGVDETERLPPIASFSPDRWVITVGSWSKLVWAGLRVGWIRASEPTIAKLARRKAVSDNGTPIIDQLVMANLMPHLDEIAVQRRAQTTALLASLTGSLTELLPSWSWRRPQGGLSMWVQLPHGTAYGFSQLALRHSVEFSPGPIFCHDDSHQNYLRLPFVAPEHVIEEGVRRLAEAWDSYETQARFRH